MSRQRTTTIDGVGDVEVKTKGYEGFEIVVKNNKHKIVIKAQDWAIKQLIHQLQMAVHSQRKDVLQQYNWLGKLLEDNTGEES